MSSYTWEEIDTTPKVDLADQYFNVGDQITINVTGNNYVFKIYGFDHDDKSDGTGKAGITFGMKGVHNLTRQINSTSSTSNAGGWDTSDSLKPYPDSTFYDSLDESLKSIIKEVDKPTANGGNQHDIDISIVNTPSKCSYSLKQR